MAPTKVLAKIANDAAKHSAAAQGVCQLSPEGCESTLEATAVEAIWGIARRRGSRLRARGIDNARQVRDAPESLLRRQLGIEGVRLQQELRGQPCYPLERNPAPKQRSCVSRSFGRPVTALAELQEAVAAYASRLGEKLRQQRQTAAVLVVFACTSAPERQPDSNAVTLTLPRATNDTRTLLHYARRGAKALFRSGHRYKKAGAIALALASEDAVQGELFAPGQQCQRAERLMQAVDAINARMGAGTIQFGAAGLSQPWRMKAELRSPRYTTRWDELPVARA